MIEFLQEKKISKKTLDLISEFALNESTKREAEREANKGIINFGKYKGKKLTEISKLDKPYIMWLQKNNKYLNQDNKEIVDQLLA
jgi:uncharacterized protein (DUF3820 family)